MLDEIRYALRGLRQNPGFALTAIVSIGLAVGANSTLFSFANGVLFRPLPVPDYSQVVTVRSLPPSVSTLTVAGTGRSRISYPDFQDLRRESRSFRGLVAYNEVIVAFQRDNRGPAEFHMGYQVSEDFFRILEVEPRPGRGFRPEEEAAGAAPVVVLSHDLWKNEFGEDPAVIGRRVVLSNLTCTVVGIAPESFTSLDQFLRPDFFIPVAAGSKLFGDLADQQNDRSRRAFLVKGRLQPGVPMRAAAQEAGALAQSLASLYPATDRGYGATVNTEIEMRLISWPILGGVVAALSTVAVVIVLLACANVANLMLGRGRARAREMAVRLAVGASRARLIRLLVIESALIALASGALAALAAQFTTGMFSRLELTSDVPIQPDFQFDTRVLWFTAVVSGASALLFGLAPAIQSTRLDLVSVMKAGEPDQGRKRFLGTYALVVAQVAGAMILLVLSVEGRRTFDDLLSGNPGFRRDHRITMRFNPEASGYAPEQTERFFDTLVKRAAETPGIRSAALASGVPMTYDHETLHFVPETGGLAAGRQSADSLVYVVDDHYFGTMGVPLLAGRSFQATDRAGAPRVAVVNQAFAQTYLGPNPIGKRLQPSGRGNSRVEVVGVSVTGKTVLLVEPPTPVIYLPLAQNPRSRMTLVAETAGDPSAMAVPLEAMVRSIDPNLPVFRVRTMEDLFERSSVAMIETVSRVYDFATTLGLVLAVVGLYAVVSFQVSRRTREIGIRMALGAERAQVAQIFLKQALLLSAGGVTIGAAASVSANRASESILGGEPPSPVLLGALSAALLLTTVAAAWIPARTASRVDPQQALRQD